MARQRGKKMPRKLTSGVAYITDLGYDGRGVAQVDGKTVFIHDALPGETIGFDYTGRHGRYDEGQCQTLLHASAERVTPRCVHHGVCGGCCLQHLHAEKQILYKQTWLLENLARIGKVQPQQVLKPCVGDVWGYRHKARLGVKYVAKKGKVLVGFRERNSAYLADLSHCHILQPRVGGLLVELARLIESLSIAKRLPQIEVAAGEREVALCFRILDSPDEADKDRFMAFGQRHDLHIYLQPGGPESIFLIWPPAERSLTYTLADQGLVLEFKPHHFIQINPAINRQMVNQALALLDLRGTERVLDLFCGLGNFTLALARHGREAVGVDGNVQLIEWARHNARRNDIANAHFFAADLTQPHDLPFWQNGGYDKVLLDPPRSGALEIIPQVIAMKPQQILYVSCHPATFARDAGELVHRFGYRLAKVGVMDMFSHTAHVEAMALFEAR